MLPSIHFAQLDRAGAHPGTLPQGRMSKKTRIDFRPKRIADDEWQVEAHCPGQDTCIIRGLRSLDEVHEWIDGPRKRAWLRSQGLAK